MGMILVIHIEKNLIFAENGLIHGFIHFIHRIFAKKWVSFMVTERTDVL